MVENSRTADGPAVAAATAAGRSTQISRRAHLATKPRREDRISPAISAIDASFNGRRHDYLQKVTVIVIYQARNERAGPMATPRVFFSCHVPKVGFRWLETHPIPPADQSRAWFLTVGREPGMRGGGGQTYNPLEEHTGLFRVFADTEPSRDGIKAFAERFGSLGGNTRTWVALYDEPRNGGYAGAWSEAYTAWRDEIVDMRRSVDLWEAARRGEAQELERKICWTEDHSSVRFNIHPGLTPSEPMQLAQGSFSSVIAERGDGILERFVPGDLVQPALFFVQRLVNQHLRTRVSPRLLWDEHETRLRLHLVPQGLVGALWLQFARAVERDSRFRQCAECGIWFELAPGTARADKLYCSTPCRTKTYRKRQAEAVRLHGEGRSIEDIARQLESDPDTVRGWIDRKRAPSDAGQSAIE